jgi:hypothetical protein
MVKVVPEAGVLLAIDIVRLMEFSELLAFIGM